MKLHEKPVVDYRLYLVTDRDLMSAPTLEEAVEKALAGGCTAVQLREKTASSREFYDLALRIKALCDAGRVPLFINDRADIARAVGAAGVHVGQDDLPVRAVREIVGPAAVVGVSASTLPEALAAEKAGADYLGIGAMFATSTKEEADLTTFEELRRIRAAVSIPLVVIGGINPRTLPQFAGTGIDGIAVVSAVLSQPDIAKAARELRDSLLSLGIGRPASVQ